MHMGKNKTFSISAEPGHVHHLNSNKKTTTQRNLCLLPMLENLWQGLQTIDEENRH